MVIRFACEVCDVPCVVCGVCVYVNGHASLCESARRTLLISSFRCSKVLLGSFVVLGLFPLNIPCVHGVNQERGSPDRENPEFHSEDTSSVSS